MTGHVLSGALRQLDQFGLTDILIPFILLFSIVYAVLAKISMFDKKNTNVIIALSIALLSIIPHATGTYQQFDIVNIINTSLPQIGLIILGLVLLMILLGLVQGDTPTLNNLFLGIAGVISVVLLLVVFWRALFPFQSPQFLRFLDDPATQSLVIILIVFGLIVYFVTKDEDGGEGKGIESLRKGIKSLFGEG